MDKERLTGHKFEWVPKHLKKNRLPGEGKPVQIGEPEKRTPLLWIARESIGSFTDGLYLVNSSDEILDEVIPQTGGFITADNEVGTVSSKAQKPYEKVEPGEAIKIDEIDAMYDSDYVLSVGVEIKSKKLGHIELYTMGEKGGVKGNLVLLWDSMETGENANLRKIH